MPGNECDVLVVGLGPAGAAAATVAAKAGARVVAVERRPASAWQMQGPEFIPFPLGSHAGAARVVIQLIAGARSHLTDGTLSDCGLQGSVVNRDVFDRALVDFARAAGADLRHGTALSGLDTDASAATIAGDGGVSVLRYRALVAADGAVSAVAGLLGMAPLKTMRTKCYRVPLNAPQNTIDVWLSPQHPEGYGWLIPAGSEAIIGTGLFSDSGSDALDALHAQLQAAGLVGGGIRAQTAGVVAVGGMRERLAWGNILLAGDAAGLAHPLTGAGIYPAVVSGEAAGQAGAEWSAGRLGAISAYEAKIRGEFGEALERALRRREPLVSPWCAESGLEASGWSVVRGAFD